MEPAALALEHIRKSFGTVAALVDASLRVRPGTVHALLGENGAGKTTLMRIAFGMLQPDAGRVLVRGAPMHLASPADAIALGIGMVHQHFTLVPAMTVAENVALGDRGMFDAQSTIARVQAIARETGLALEPSALVADLPVSAQQRLELLKALVRDAAVLVLDEPTALLAPSEADELLRILRQLADRGRAIVLITHRLREALAVADDITIMRRGVTMWTGAAGASSEADLVSTMLGEQALSRTERARPRAPARQAIISARNISVERDGLRRVHGATFDVHSGEIVGVAAVEGAGHRELLRAIARRLSISSGELVAPADVGFVPDDRHRDGLVMEMSLVENYALRDAGQRRGLMRWGRIAADTRRVIDDFDVRAPGVYAHLESLSGGNQQRFLLGRELEGPPPALVVENPTRGLDVRASAYVFDRLRAARDAGVAVVMYSTDLDEVIELADRMLVVFSGTVSEVAPERTAVGRAMLGAA